MKVRVRIPEFTWHDEKGYHTVAHVGEVPAGHPAVAAALKKGYLVPSEETGDRGPMTGPAGPPSPVARPPSSKSAKKEA